MNSIDKAKYLIKNNLLMTVSTADDSGKPWVSPVGYICDDSYNLYWVSNKDALHSHNIRNRPEVAIVIVGELPEGDIDGVYYDATAKELTEEDEIKSAIAIRANMPGPDKFKVKSPLDVTGDAVWRIYRASPVSVSKRINAEIKGQAITTREPIDLV